MNRAKPVTVSPESASTLATEFLENRIFSAPGLATQLSPNLESDESLRHDGRFGGHLTTFRVSADRETVIMVACNSHLANRFGIADELGAIWSGVIDGD